MLQFISETDQFLAGARPSDAQAGCDLTRTALGMPGWGGQPARLVDLLRAWLARSTWWQAKAEDAVTRHCGHCPAESSCRLHGATEVASRARRTHAA